MQTNIFIGCAGWSIPRSSAGQFPADGTHLQRYAARFAAVEINSSFYRPHRASTYARWAESVPADFRFSIKMPKQITHELRLRVSAELLEKFLAEVSGLAAKLGCLLLQLPPSLQFDAAVAHDFLALLRRRTTAAVVCEPRHATWFTPKAEELLREHQVGRVAADPACVELASSPGAWCETVYYRLHGSPRTYYSAYDAAYLEALAQQLAAARGRQVWCIFDNTALGAATENAQQLLTLVGQAKFTQRSANRKCRASTSA
jgi:uncharacterized protein YecE (DUF72 family)